MSQVQLSRRRLLGSVAAAGAGLAVGTAQAASAKKANVKYDLTCDVLVVGGGLSGLGAAIMASRAGAKVCLIEQRTLCGGDGVLSEGVFHSSKSVVHEQQGFTDKDKIAFEYFWEEQCRGLMDDDVMNNVRDNTTNSPMYHAYCKRDLKVMENVARNCTNAISLLVGYGVKFKPIDPQLRFLQCVQRNEMSTFVMGALEELEKNGVKVINDLHASELIVGSDGGVDGLKAEYVRGDNKGRKLAIKAGRTILATGGFLDNDQMMRRYKRFWAGIPAGWTFVGEGLPKDHNGDGIEMARKIGASLESMESVPKFYAAGDKGKHIPSWLIFKFDKAYFLGENGKRLHNEFIGWYTGCVLSLVQHGFVLFDEETFSGKNHDYWGLQRCLESGGLIKCNTIEDIAKATGIKAAAIKETIDRINRDAAAGKDTEFGRTDTFFKPLKAPYYVSSKGYPVRYKTEGGLEVNPQFEVLRSVDLKPIGRLYAVGAGCGSMTTRNGDVLSAGMLAGTNAVKSLKA